MVVQPPHSFNEYLPRTYSVLGDCTKCWRYNGEQNGHGPCPHGAQSPVENTSCNEIITKGNISLQCVVCLLKGSKKKKQHTKEN